MFHENIKPICRCIKLQYIMYSCLILVLSFIFLFFSTTLAVLLFIGEIIAIPIFMISYYRICNKMENILFGRFVTSNHVDHCEMHIIFDQEKVEIKQDKYSNTFLYKDITDICETSNYYVLKFEQLVYLFVDKNRFIYGNIDELKKILTDAGVKIR